MTVSNPNSSVTVTGTGAATVFNYTFPVPSGAGFALILTDTTTGEQTTVATSDYSVSGLGNSAGGTFTYPLAGDPIPATQTLTFSRQVAYAQSTNFGNQDGYYPQVVETTLDIIVMQIQQLLALVNSGIHQPVGDTIAFATLPAAPLRANKTLGFDAAGQLKLI